jgi:hypothetical protein
MRQDGLERKFPLGHADHADIFLAAVRGKSELIYVLVRINPYALEGRFELFQALGKHLLLQCHGGVGVLERPVVHRDDLLYFRRDHGSRRTAQRQRPRRAGDQK